MTLPLAAEYRDAVRVALTLQVMLTAVFLMLLDGFRMARIGGCAMAGFWIGAAIIMLRRPRNPRALDLVYIRYGYLAMVALGIVIASVVTHIRGH